MMKKEAVHYQPRIYQEQEGNDKSLSKAKRNTVNIMKVKEEEEELQPEPVRTLTGHKTASASLTSFRLVDGQWGVIS